MNELGRVRSKQGMIKGRMLSLGFDSKDDAVLSNISMELARSSEIEGEKLNLGEVGHLWHAGLELQWKEWFLPHAMWKEW